MGDREAKRRHDGTMPLPRAVNACEEFTFRSAPTALARRINLTLLDERATAINREKTGASRRKRHVRPLGTERARWRGALVAARMLRGGPLCPELEGPSSKPKPSASGPAKKKAQRLVRGPCLARLQLAVSAARWPRSCRSGRHSRSGPPRRRRVANGPASGRHGRLPCESCSSTADPLPASAW